MRTAVITSMIVAIDQGTKSLATGGIVTAPWIDPRSNPDLALGILGGSTEAEIVIAAVGIVLGLALARSHTDRIGSMAVGLAVGGALGNLVDRVLFGEVRDFIVGPNILFNLADLALLSGLLLVVTARPRPAQRKIKE